MNKKFLEQIKEMMIQVFNDGYEQLIMPRFEELEESIKESENRVKKELKEEFKAGQQSLSGRLEVVERKMDKMDKKMDQVVASDKDQDFMLKEQEKRLNKVERIIKAN